MMKKTCRDITQWERTSFASEMESNWILGLGTAQRRQVDR